MPVLGAGLVSFLGPTITLNFLSNILINQLNQFFDFSALSLCMSLSYTQLKICAKRVWVFGYQLI